jgi:predicted nucleic acid-binding protein
VADLLVDTDVLIDHLRGARRFDPGAVVVHYSVVTRCELYAGRATDEDRVDVLLGPFMEVGVDRQIAARAGRLRRELPIRMPDALIAATALERGLTLLTRNRKDFQSVPGLAIQSP